MVLLAECVRLATKRNNFQRDSENYNNSVLVVICTFVHVKNAPHDCVVEHGFSLRGHNHSFGMCAIYFAYRSYNNEQRAEI